MTDHDFSVWCWCRPRVLDGLYGEMICHRDVEPGTLSSRYLWGGEATAPDDGISAVPWWHEDPTSQGGHYES